MITTLTLSGEALMELNKFGRGPFPLGSSWHALTLTSPSPPLLLAPEHHDRGTPSGNHDRRKAPWARPDLSLPNLLSDAFETRAAPPKVLQRSPRPSVAIGAMGLSKARMLQRTRRPHSSNEYPAKEGLFRPLQSVQKAGGHLHIDLTIATHAGPLPLHLSQNGPVGKLGNPPFE
eukprot:2824793-Alexandrium_andersonii.AAC.1